MPDNEPDAGWFVRPPPPTHPRASYSKCELIFLEFMWSNSRALARQARILLENTTDGVGLGSSFHCNYPTQLERMSQPPPLAQEQSPLAHYASIRASNREAGSAFGRPCWINMETTISSPLRQLSRHECPDLE